VSDLQLEKRKAYRDGTIIEVARLIRPKTKKIKRKRKIYSKYLKKEIEDESIRWVRNLIKT
ncbi:MAG: hypothetical protein JHC31_11135, partial [Sulfurihydrogenibium sp.]|nr:hypothetical protein [Sulfurihydrogenibium sp.]